MYNQTVLNPIALAFTLVMCIAILKVKREYIIVPLILVACFITNMQRISIAGVDFSMLRIITILGLLRIAVRGERLSMTFNTIDKIMVYYSIIRIITYTILWSSGSALVFMLGQSLDTLGAYFLIRLAINDLTEYDVIIKTIVFSSIFISIFMVVEHLSGGRNIFYIFGGVLEFSEIRNGRLRAQGAFGHSILAGTFGATFLPLCWGLWNRNYKFLAFCGAIASLIITFASSSSGPVLALITGFFGILFWNFRKFTKIARNSFFLMVVFLHLVMKAPVWHLISRIDVVGGSTGYHRFLLIDAFVNNFVNWLAFGVRETRAWGHGLQDITNQYILEGVRGGIIPLILFIIVIIKCFKTIGVVRARVVDDVNLQKYVWAMGVSLLTHIVSFISVSYFEQLVFFYYLLIALISSLNNLPVNTAKNNNL